jgi:superfamily I DNA/RNA helicase
MDFTDLLERCLLEFPRAPGDPAAIFFDEAQDVSKLQTSLLAQWGEHCERVVLAGDDDQAIYFWAGADAEGFLRFPCPRDQHRYLRQSYRVPRAVHAVAQKWISRLGDRREPKEFIPRDADGFVRPCGASWYHPEAAVSLAEKHVADGQTVMFLVPCSFMLNPLKRVLRERALPFHNPWRRKRGDWNPLAPGAANRVMPADRVLALLRPDPGTWEDAAAGWTRDEVFAWASPLRADGCLERGAKKALAAYRKDGTTASLFDLCGLFTADVMAALDALGTPDGHRAPLAWWLDHLLEAHRPKLEFAVRVAQARGGAALRDPPRVIIGTGHSLKGSEADVCFVFPELSRAGSRSWHTDPDGHDGIVRLFYVMLTRPREGLYVCQNHHPYRVPVPVAA